MILNIFSIPIKLSILSIIKLIIIFLLIILNVYLVYICINKPFKEENENYILSGINIPPALKNTLLIAFQSFSFYAAVKSLDNSETNANLNKLLLERNKHIENLKNINDKEKYDSMIEKTKMVSILGKIQEQNKETYKYNLNTEKENITLQELESKKNAYPNNESDKIKEIVEEIRRCKIRRDYNISEFKKSEKSLENLYKEMGLGDIIKKSSFFDIISEKIENLDTIGLIAFSLLLGSNVIISCLISIIFVFYGDILLKKFKIEEKFPNLAKIINLRLKFQRYYLILAILYIFSVALSQLLFGIVILSK